MTTLELIQNPPDLETLRGLFIAVTQAQCDLIDSTQDANSNMRVAPVPLTDGRFALCADLLSEIHEGGIFYGAFSNLTLDSINETEILTTEQFKALRPPREPVE